MSATVPKNRHGHGTKFQMGDGAPVFTVTIAATPTGGVAPAVGATTLNVTALPGALANGTLLLFGVGKLAELTAAAAAGAITLAVKPLEAALAVGDTAEGGENFATIAEFNDLTPPNPSRSTFDTSHYHSPEGYMQFGSGMVDPGTASVAFNWLPRDPTQDNTTGLEKAFNDGTPRNFRIVWPQLSPAVVRAFTALVTSYPTTVPLNDRMTGSCELKISGRIRRF